MRNTSRPAIAPASFVAVRCASSKYAGTVITACVTVSPKYASASRLSFINVRALISCGVYFLPSTSSDFQFSPMWRLMLRNVRSGLVIAWRLATSPTNTSPAFENATTEGVVREPSEFGITTASPASKTATTELVVPRSIPTAFAMMCTAPECCGVIRGFLVSITLGVVEEPHNPQTIKVECISLNICHIGQNWQ